MNITDAMTQATSITTTLQAIQAGASRTDVISEGTKSLERAAEKGMTPVGKTHDGKVIVADMG